MPQVRRHNLPEAVFRHLLARVRQREIPYDQLQLFADWLELEPEVPTGQWYRRFPGMIVCGEGELVKTFLLPTQTPIGEELE